MFLSVRLLCRVFLPSVGKAQGVCGWLPFTLPSPPPCGWSTGFMATPRTVGLIPLQVVHLRARRNVPELHGISRKNVRAFAGRNGGANFEAHGMQNVALVAI